MPIETIWCHRLTEHTPIHAGEFIVISSGSYDDYGLVCVCRVVKAFDVLDFPRQGGTLYKGILLDLERLTAEGYVEEIPVREIHNGEY